MKKILFLLLLPFLMYSQTIKLTEYPHGNDKEFYFVGTSLDSGTATSSEFELNQFDNSLGTKTTVATDDTAYVVTSVIQGGALGYYLVLDSLAGSSPIVGVYIQGKMTNGTWANVDTVIASDTLNLYHGNLTSRGLIDLNAGSYVFPKYRVAFVSSNDPGPLYTAKLSLYAFKRD